MPDAEYQRARRAKLKLIKEGKIAAPEPKPTMAEHMREYRKRQKSKLPSAVAATRQADEGLERAILRRGRELTEMMRTPVCMWPKEWENE